MSNHIYNYRDTNLSLYQVDSNYTLLLQIYRTSFSYAIVNQNKLMAWAENCDIDILAAPGDDHDLLRFDYQNVVVGLHAEAFTLIPDVLFNEDKIADFARYLDVKTTDKVLAQRLDADNYIVYKVTEQVADIANKYGIQNVVFENKGLINSVAHITVPTINFYINIHQKQADILYIANGKLRFLNSFEFNNPDELSYYAAFVAQELQLEPKTLILVLSGNIDITDKEATRLADFFNGVELNELSPLTLPTEVKPHRVLSIAALSLCVSSEVF